MTRDEFEALVNTLWHLSGGARNGTTKVFMEIMSAYDTLAGSNAEYRKALGMIADFDLSHLLDRASKDVNKAINIANDVLEKFAKVQP